MEGFTVDQHLESTNAIENLNTKVAGINKATEALELRVGEIHKQFVKVDSCLRGEQPGYPSAIPQLNDWWTTVLDDKIHTALAECLHNRIGSALSLGFHKVRDPMLQAERQRFRALATQLAKEWRELYGGIMDQMQLFVESHLDPLVELSEKLLARVEGIAEIVEATKERQAADEHQSKLLMREVEKLKVIDVSDRIRTMI